MTDIFLKLLNMSISASWLVLAVVLLRLLFKKAPKWISCLLWSIVALRLVMPFSFESAFSLIPSAEVIPQNIMTSQTPAIYSGIPAVNSTINPMFTQYLAPEDHTLETVLSVAAAVWLVGVAAMLLYSAVSYWRLRRQVRASIPLPNQLYVCDDVGSPFILGTLFPKIYIPSGMDEGQLQYVLAHESAHLKRLDHWWKPLGFLLLTLYWFNPLLWLAYVLLCRDIERACDEKVITQLDNAGKKGYSEALVACSVHRRMVMACPVAFGEVGVKARIKGIIRYQKPAFWIILASVAVCSVTAVCFLTNPMSCRHSYISQITESSTCTHKGIQTLTCKQCDHSYTTRAELLSHTYEQGAVLTQPDCTHLGSRELVCSDCGAVKMEAIAQTEHIHGVPFLSKGPNCVEAGEMSAECTVCHAVHVVETIEPNRVHNLQETLLQEATCAVPGEGIITCSRCDFSESHTYPQLAHNYVDGMEGRGSCTTGMERKMVCTGCGDHYWTPWFGPTSHQWVTYNGFGHERCRICGTTKPKNTSQHSSWIDELFKPPATKTPEDLHPVIRWDYAFP